MKIRAALALAILSLALPAGAQTAETYRISARVHQDGQLIGAPTMTVRSGESATIGVEGAKGYVLTASAEPVAGASADQARVKAELTLNARPDAEPRAMTMVVRLDELARLEFGAATVVEITVAR